EHDDANEVVLHPAVKLSEYDEPWMDNDHFRLEVCKIILFRWIIGCHHTTYDDIEVIDDMPVSANEEIMTTREMNKEILKLLYKQYGDVLGEAMKEVTKYADYDDVRGCLAQSSQPCTSFVRLHIKAIYNTNVRNLVETITERIDILETTDEDSLQQHLKELL
ncbi:MAG: hypothetical protein ACMG6E_03275, partial [Candidatus Roizmanbacteria bacterium]